MWLLKVKEKKREEFTDHMDCPIKTAVKPWSLTDEAEDVADGGHKDDQQIDKEDETKRDADVHDPAERLVREKDLKQGPADLRQEDKRRGRTL